nr:hypothetical protein CFP56_06485 [Quercus suber]
MDVKRFFYTSCPRIVKRGKTYQLPRVTEVRIEEIRKNGIFTMLGQNPHIGQSKEPNCGGVCSHGDHYSDSTSEQDLAHCCELDL